MELINNQDKLLGDDLKREIKKGSRVRIAASCFSIYAFDALKEELKDIEELQFIFSSPAFIEDKVSDKLKKEKREFYIPQQLMESSLYGTQFEIKLRNKLTQKAIAKECAQWIREKARFKSNNTGNAMPNFISIDNRVDQATYLPVNGFTTGELGYEDDHALFQAITKMNDQVSSTLFINQFQEIWEDPEKIEDVTDKITEYIASVYQENAPEYIYFLILYNIFSEFLEDLSEDYMPNDRTGFKESLVWQKLYNYQRDGAIGIINKLEKYNGCILADSVGLGKTFTALAVMHYYDLKNKSILVLCPKKLAKNWINYQGNVKTNIFYQDRIRFDVLNHTDLGRKSGMSNGKDLANVYWENYDLIVIDESHNFRNDYAIKGKETRYQFLMNKVMKPGVKTKVLMLSATPVNNKFKDLKNQLALAYGDDLEAFENKLETEHSIRRIFIRAQKVFNDWSKLPQEERKAKDLIDQLDIDFAIVLDSVTIARSRKHIVKYYDTKDIGSFPKRLTPRSYNCNLSKRADVIQYDAIYEQIISMKMSLYAPTIYILPSKKADYEELYDTKVEGRGTLKQLSREKSLQRLMSIMLLKRLESSVEAFRITLKNILKNNQEILEKIHEQQNGNQVSIEKRLNEFSEEDDEALATGEWDMGKETTVGKVKIHLADMDLYKWERELKMDVNILENLIGEMEKVTLEEDAKLAQLKAVIDQKMTNPINESNKKILIFSAFSDTATYLYNHLSFYIKSKYGLETAKVEGGTGGNKTTLKGVTDLDKILTLFSPLSKEKDLLYPDEKGVIDVLIGTDCISEGQNLQDCDICINYDIHWNPVRIVQRFGRIDRIGSRNTCIQLVNFWPNISLDEYIKLNDRVAGRMIIVDATATADDNPISEEQAEFDYRKEQLKKLKQGELQDLEDVDGSITITDLGLNEFRMDLTQYIKLKGEPKHAPKGMHAVVRSAIEKGATQGVIYVLRNISQEVNINKQNRLHPYYIVYIQEDGEIKINHLGVKNTLDLLRTTCKNQTEPLQDVCKLFNQETKEGSKMDKYSNLLEKAALSIVQVKEESDLSSLFTSGSQVLFQQTIKGLDDFELIAFVVVR